ncbi:hypothetical protein ACFCV3_42020 [Kribbella sp. NPDC056345]|uniref:hypothetical protein n=1 Tax=Kribbella sp. NPDC056345 TaxID=3345789 RepID=UPI0035E21F84
MSTEPAAVDAFEAFAKASGLEDLFGLDAAAYTAPDDLIGATDDDGDSLVLQYAERTVDDGKVCGLVAICTDGPTGVALLTADGMTELVTWLQARIVRARRLAK